MTWGLGGCHGSGNPSSESEKMFGVTLSQSALTLCPSCCWEEFSTLIPLQHPEAWGHTSLSVKPCSQQGRGWKHSTLQDKKAELCKFGLSEVRETFLWRVCYTLLWSNFLTFQLIVSGLEQLLLFTVSCIRLCDPMDCTTPGFPVHHYLLEFAQIHVHWVGDVIQASHPLLSPSPSTLNLSQHQGLS